MDVVAGNVVACKAKLIEKRYQPGQKFARYSFQTKEGVCIAISRDAEMLRTSTIGEKYALSGREYTVGDKVFIHEPSMVLAGSGIFKSHKRLATAVACLVVAVGISGTVFAMTHNSDQGRSISTTNASNNTPQTEPVVQDTPVSTVTEKVAQPDASPANTTSQPQPVAAASPTIAKRPTVAVTTASLPVSNAAPVIPPTPIVPAPQPLNPVEQPVADPVPSPAIPPPATPPVGSPAPTPPVPTP